MVDLIRHMIIDDNHHHHDCSMFLAAWLTPDLSYASNRMVRECGLYIQSWELYLQCGLCLQSWELYLQCGLYVNHIESSSHCSVLYNVTIYSVLSTRVTVFYISLVCDINGSTTLYLALMYLHIIVMLFHFTLMLYIDFTASHQL